MTAALDAVLAPDTPETPNPEPDADRPPSPDVVDPPMLEFFFDMT